MIAHVKDGQIEADVVIEFEPLEIIPLMRTRLFWFRSPSRMFAARSMDALDAAIKDRQEYLAQPGDRDVCDAERA